MRIRLLLGLCLAGTAMAATSATQHGFTWTWVEDVPVYYSVLGDPCVVAPSGITITSITPASTQDPVTGRIINGSTVNPSSSRSNAQGFDSAARDNVYNPALNHARPGGADLSPSNPLFVPANSSVMSAKSIISPLQLRPQISDAAVLTVLATTPPADFFRPSPYGSGTRTIPAVLSDINWAALPSLPKPAGASWPADLSTLSQSDRLARVWVEIGTEYSGRTIHPLNNMPAYGRDMARTVESAMLYLCLDYSNAQKAHVLYGLLQYGIDLYGARQNGGYWTANGGHNAGRMGVLVLAGHLLGKNEYIDAANQINGRWFQEQETAFYVGQSDIDRTQNNAPGSGAWDPDDRSPPVRYSQDMLSVPEWGIRHATKPASDNAHWQATYRQIGYNHMVGYALVAHIMGIREQWNLPAFFDYIDRYWFVESSRGVFGGSNDISNRARYLWLAYRELPGHSEVWGKDGQIATIVNSPAARTVVAGTATTLSVTAYGIPGPSYQWLKGGTPIAGATASQYTIASASASDAGMYSVRVTNPSGTIETYPVSVTVQGEDPGDTTPPVWTTVPFVESITQTAANLRATANESGTLYWLLRAGGSTTPTVSQVTTGSGGVAAGNVPLSALVQAVAGLAGLSPSTTYDVYVVAVDAATNAQAAPAKVTFTTAAVPDPDPAPNTGVGERRRPGARTLFR